MNIKELQERTEAHPNELSMLIEDAFGGWRFGHAGGQVTLAVVRDNGVINVNVRHPDAIARSLDNGITPEVDHETLSEWLNIDSYQVFTRPYKARQMVSELYGIPLEEVVIKWRVLKPRR